MATDTGKTSPSSSSKTTSTAEDLNDSRPTRGASDDYVATAPPGTVSTGLSPELEIEKTRLQRDAANMDANNVPQDNLEVSMRKPLPGEFIGKNIDPDAVGGYDGQGSDNIMDAVPEAQDPSRTERAIKAALEAKGEKRGRRS